MTIREIEARCQMERANIRFYEREGLLTAQRLPNGYRDYTEEDVQTLLRIRLLRSLHVSLDDIRALQSGEKALSDTLRAQLAQLEREQQQAAAAEAVCREIEAAHVGFSELDAPKYLEQLERGAPPAPPAFPAEDRFPVVRCPFRRFFARMLDDLLYTALACAILALCHVRLNMQTGAIGPLIALLTLALNFLFEPLFLHYSGTTPGKALLGLSIETEDGERLSVSEARWRLWGVIWRGGGLGIPILNLFRLYKSMDELLEGHPMPWDDGKVVLLRDAKRWRIPAWCLAAAFAVFLGLLPQAAQRLAPNRGPLTPAQFAENYNYYAWYLDCGSGWLLQPDGTWREPTTENGAVSFYRVHEPDLRIETENGAVTRVSFSFSPEASAPNFYSFYPQMLLSALSLSGAQPEGGLFSGVPVRLAEAIPDVPGSFTVTEGGVRLTCDVFSKNYYLTDTICFPDDEAPAGECVFTLTFAAEIQP